MSHSELSQKVSQAQTLLNHLQTHGRITKLEALNLYGIWNSGGRIFDLKRAGHPIDTRMIEVSSGKKVAEYRLVLVDGNGQTNLRFE